MPWQQHVADVALEVDAAGVPIYRSVDLLVPRQSGKTTLILALTIHRAMAFGRRQRITYAAQTGQDAAKKWNDDWLPILRAADALHGLFEVRLDNNLGRAILWGPGAYGSIQDLMAGTERAGHGGTRDLCIADEFFAQQDNRLQQAFTPSMATRADAQFWRVSTAGTAASVPLRKRVDAGRRRCKTGKHGRTAYFEWSAPDDADRYSPATWRACMPALGHTITEATVLAEVTDMDADEFDRAYLNRWGGDRKSERIISETVWDECMDATSQPGECLSWALDVSPGGGSAAFAVASMRPDGRRHVEVVDHRDGDAWVVARAVELRDRHGVFELRLVAGSPAMAKAEDLRAAGITVEVVSGSTAAAAAAGFVSSAVAGEVAHLGQASLNVALDGAVKKMMGDVWTLARKRSTTDICSLVAVSIAHRFAQVQPEAPAKRKLKVW
jgi:phage terminase large subunit-like protein